jgi:hypothetical protein
VSPWDKRKTEYILGISGVETSFYWLVDPLKEQRNPIAKGCLRVPIGLEGINSPIRAVVRSDKTIMAYLTAEGYVAEDGLHWAKSVRSDPAATGPIKAQIFEDSIRYRYRALMQHFSIGPTQQNLLYFAAKYGTPEKCWPQTWEDLWDTYMGNRQYIWLARAGCYLTPAPSDDSEGTVIKWLARQTGNYADAETYYYKENGFKQHFSTVRTVILKHRT